MNRTGIAVVLTITLFASPALAKKKPPVLPAPSAEETLEHKIQQVRPSIVEVWVDGRRNGSGFIVSDHGHILTAIHVVGEPQFANNKASVKYSQNIEVTFNDGKKVKATPVDNPDERSVLYDMALLRTDRAGTVPLQLSQTPLIPLGSPVFVMGFPLDLPNAVTYQGIVASEFPIQSGMLRGVPVSRNHIQIEAPIAKGFSGCPLLDFKTNTVVGVVVTKLGGITQGLADVAKTIQEGAGRGTVRIMGVDPNAATLQLIGVMDAYLSAGSGFAVSIEHISPFVRAITAQK